MSTKPKNHNTIEDNIEHCLNAIVQKAPSSGDAIQMDYKGVNTRLIKGWKQEITKMLKTKLATLDGADKATYCHLLYNYLNKGIYKRLNKISLFENHDDDGDGEQIPSEIGYRYRPDAVFGLVDKLFEHHKQRPEGNSHHSKAGHSHQQKAGNGRVRHPHYAHAKKAHSLAVDHRIGYRHASLMGVETEGPARDGGLVIRTSH